MGGLCLEVQVLVNTFGILILKKVQAVLRLILY